jgi:SAM-dependent methyltransferase
MIQKFFYNLWYYRHPPWDTGISPPELMEYINSHVPGSALDLGCGTGTNAITLAKYGWRVTGIDFAWRAIRVARQKAQKARVDIDLRVADVAQIKLPGEFDLILDIGCFHGLSYKGRRSYIQNLNRMLAVGGIYLMYGFYKKTDETGPGLVETDLELFRNFLKLISRKDGTDRGSHPSAWFTFRRIAQITS